MVVQGVVVISGGAAAAAGSAGGGVGEYCFFIGVALGAFEIGGGDLGLIVFVLVVVHGVGDAAAVVGDGGDAVDLGCGGGGRSGGGSAA